MEYDLILIIFEGATEVHEIFKEIHIVRVYCNFYVGIYCL